MVLTASEDSLSFQASLDYIAEQAGGMESFLDACAISDLPRLQAFLATYRSLSMKERRDLTLNDLCVRCGHKPTEILSDWMATVIMHQNNLSLLVAAMGRPDQIRASLATGMIIGPEGFADRKLNLELGGLIKGTGVNIVQQLGLNIQTAGLPSFEEDSTAAAQTVQSGGRSDRALPASSLEFIPDLSKDLNEREAAAIPHVQPEKD